MGLFIVLLLFYILPFAGMAKLFEKAGLPSWHAYLPGHNIFAVTKVTGSPKWWVIVAFIPVINFFVLGSIYIDVSKSFGRYRFVDNLLAIIFPFAYFPFLSYGTKPEYKGPAFTQAVEYKQAIKEAVKKQDKRQLKKLKENTPFPKKPVAREWTESILFAVFAAHFIRMFLIEAYTIPTPSMEGSLMVGDFLFVSKVHYGSRMPITPVSFPLVHSTLPKVGSESYTKAVQLDYTRAPRIQNVELFDPVVFNYPEGDTVFGGLDPTTGGPIPYPMQFYNLLYSRPASERENIRKQLKKAFGTQMVVRPVDKRDHYIKRCVGLPGNKIEVKAGWLYIDGEKAPDLDGVQYEYKLQTVKPINMQHIYDNYAVYSYGSGAIYTTPKVARRLVNEIPDITACERVILQKGVYMGKTFPYNEFRFPWNIDHYGPITIPSKGTGIELSLENIDLYSRLITAYESNTLEIKGTDIFINGEKTTSYIPKMDYYWMMGDNRNNSADSRSWGFVPEDHVVGKPLFVWFSVEQGKGIRWDRLFTSALGK